MLDFEQEKYDVFQLFKKNWALATAGTKEDFNTCTIGWGSMGSLWTNSDKGGSILTVYIHPSRHTFKYFKDSEYFTVSFFPPEYKKALAYLGTHSGKDEDKVLNAGLTPVEIGDSVTFEEAERVFLCRKLYQHQLVKEDVADSIIGYYDSNPLLYPKDKDNEIQMHWEFIGEIVPPHRGRS